MNRRPQPKPAASGSDLTRFADTSVSSFEAVADGSPSSTGEQRLYQAVLIQALLDATRSDVSSLELVSATAQAKALFEKEQGIWADHLEFCCDIAGFYPSEIRRFYNWTVQKGVAFNRKRMLSLLREFEKEWQS